MFLSSRQHLTFLRDSVLRSDGLDIGGRVFILISVAKERTTISVKTRCIQNATD
jgi:hypothetical protein